MLPGPRTVKIAVQPRYSAASASFKVKSAKTFRPIAIKAPIWEFKTIPLYRQPSFVHIKSSFQRPQIRYFSTQNVGETNTTEEPLFTIEGNNVPSAIPSFEAIPSFPPALRETVANLGWKSLIKVQQYAIPAALQNRDLLISSQTGTGKTAAFLIPMVMNILNDRKSNPPSQFDYAVSPRGLVLVPTRELAQQVAREASKLCVGTNVRSMAIFGGTGVRGQLQDLQSRRPDIIIATPGRLLDLRARGAITSSRIKHVVLDEGDMMLDMGFMPQVKEVLGDPTLNPKRQLCFFSATYPKEIKKVAEEFLRDPVKIFVGLNKPSALITQKVVYVSGNSEKEQMLLEFVRTAGVSSRTLVFAQTKKRTDALFHFLRFNGIRVACIHGDHIQVERDLAVEAFSKGDVSVLVATNVASRGLDIKGVSHVVNYDFPQSMEPYIHRIGRTGRAGIPGTALSFFSDNDFELAADLKQVLAECKQVIPDFLSQVRSRSVRNLSTSSAPSDMPFDASSPLPTTGRGNWMESRGSPQRSFSQPYQQQPYQQRPPPYQQQPYQQPYRQPYQQPYQQSNRAPASWWGPQQPPGPYQQPPGPYQQPPGPYQQPPQPYQQPPQPYQQPPGPYQQPPRPYQQPPQPYQQPPQPPQQPPQPYQQPPQPYQQPPQPPQQPPQPPQQSQQPPQRKPGGLDLMSLLDDKPE